MLLGIAVFSWLCAEAVKSSTKMEEAAGDDLEAAKEQRQVTKFWLTIATISYTAEFVIAVIGILKVA